MQNSPLPSVPSERLPDLRLPDPPMPPPAALAAAAAPDALLAELLFAARDVAGMQFFRAPCKSCSLVATVFCCAECREEQLGPPDSHAPGCRTGRLVRILLELAEIDFFQFLSQSTNERSFGEERGNTLRRTGAPLSARPAPNSAAAPASAETAAEGGAR